MKIELSRFDSDAVTVVQRLRRFDHQAYIVGGCVRDLLLDKKPKDFDVATSATPPDIRRLFRNCRIIGRRFRLAHVFYGQKIIETSTFRANPRAVEDDDRDDAPEGAEPDLLIRRDNVFGTEVEDARRRDFTINGLFYDVDSHEVIDHVDGLRDIEARVVRMIGDPDIRFREDPIRILRAIKFAARCDLTIEPDTYRSMIANTTEVAKASSARVSEEFFRLLRAGAGKRSMELLIEFQLLPLMLPALHAWLQGDAAADPSASRDPGTPRDPDSPAADADGAAARPVAGSQARFWDGLAALDACTLVRSRPPSNAVVLACIFFPMLRAALDPDDRSVRDVGTHVTNVMRPVIEQLRISRRDAEAARQLILLLRHVLPGKDRQPRSRPRLAHGDLEADLAWLLAVVAKVEGLSPAELPDMTPQRSAYPARSAYRAEASGVSGPAGATTPTGHFIGGVVADEPARIAAGGLHPIPALPRGPVEQQRPGFLGTGSFGRVFGGSWSGSAE